MEKRRKSRTLFSLMSIALLFTLISTCLMSGTLAKYTSTATGSDSARVAKWGFDGINTVDIFKLAYDSTVDAAVKVVAPGTGNQFSFGFKSGTSEVDTKITVSIDETNTSNIPIVYEYNSTYYSIKNAEDYLIASMRSYEEGLKDQKDYWFVHWSNDNKHVFSTPLPYYLPEDELVDYLQVEKVMLDK